MSLRQKIVDAQRDNPYLEERVHRVESGQDGEFSVSAEGGLFYQRRLCVPAVSDIKDELLSKAYSSLFSIHPSNTKMYRDLTCESPEVESSRLVTAIECTRMEVGTCVYGLYCGVASDLKGFTVIWIVVYKLTKLAYFIPGKSTFLLNKWAQIYMKEVVRLHGVLVSIMPDRDPRFTSNFWKILQEALGTRLEFITAFHPQTDGQIERLN
ncbi:uncharacterized protein LOC120090759 [Benincasa hispida]|uniref:uncharacterized protein LOC120090759 n=1 Tax=Benincasa hispida TaxID=102211 RepID=UPI0018FF950B|nr:uncharacterized protein LOC120090759 [Benincasa hispida]